MAIFNLYMYLATIGLSVCLSVRLSIRLSHAGTRGRVRAGPSLQLGTLSTRTALYTRRWRASPGVLTHTDYTLGSVAPLLACLRTPAVLRTAHILGPGGPLPHAKNEVDRTTRSEDYTLGSVAPLLACLRMPAQILGPGGPLPHAKNEVDRTTLSGDMGKPSAERLTDTRQQTRDRQTRLTNQPTSQPFCQYPAVSWELSENAS